MVEVVSEFDVRKRILFDTALKVYKKADSTSVYSREKADANYRRFGGMYKAIEIMGFEREFREYCYKNGWDITIP